MTLRTSWAVQDAINQEDARVHMAAGWMPGLRATSPYGDMPIARAGFRPGYGGVTPGKVTMVSDTQCTVAPFQLVLPSRRGSVTGGAYIITNDSTLTINLEVNADVSLSRIDRLAVVQNDTFYNDSGSSAQIVQVKGPASATPTLPSIAGDYFELARWTVPKNTTNLRTVTVARLAPPPSGQPVAEEGADRFTVAAGGVLPVPNEAARDLLTASGWAGLTVYILSTGATEVLSGPGGSWKRVGAGSSVLQMIGDMTPAAQPVKQDCTIYVFRDDLYLWRTPGVWTRLTYNSVDRMEWVDCELPSSQTNSTFPQIYPMARKNGALSAQLSGLIYGDAFKTKDLDNHTLLCRLPAGMRPAQTQTFPVATEFAGDDVTTAKVVIGGDSGGGGLPGQVYYFCPADLKAKWVSLDGIQVFLDDPSLT